MDIEHHDLDAASSNSNIKAHRYCSWSVAVPLNNHNLSVNLPLEERENEEFKLEFSFPYTRGSEFDKTMYVLKQTEFELVTLTPENHIVLEAGVLKKISP